MLGGYLLGIAVGWAFTVGIGEDSDAVLILSGTCGGLLGAYLAHVLAGVWYAADKDEGATGDR